jgi:hypothetical protein
MSKHKSTIEGYDNMKALAKDLTNLRYDALHDLMFEMAKQLYWDAIADNGRNRIKLADKLVKVADHMGDASLEMAEIWKLCEPYMETEENE